MIPTRERRRLPAQDLHRATVGEEDVVRRGERVRLALAAGCVQAEPVAEPRDHPRLVLRDPVADAVAETAGDGLHVLGECTDRVAGRPAAAVLERLRKIPVVQRRVGLDPVGEQLVDEAVVEVEPGGVRPTAPVGQHPGPGDREAEGVETELSHQPDVLRIAVVRVARHRTVVAVPDVAGHGAEPVPDALAAAVLVGRALDLVRRRRRPPDEGGWKLIHFSVQSSILSFGRY